MNKDQLQGHWHELKGKIKENWGKLSDDEITQINGKREILLGTLQKKYGYAKEKAEQELTRFESQFDWSHSENEEIPHATTSKGSHKNKEKW